MSGNNVSSERLALDSATHLLLYCHFHKDIVDEVFYLKLFDLMHELQLKIVSNEC